MIQKLKIINYRNFSEEEFSFSEKFNYIYGKNGSGKTNLLEAIYLFFNGKSFRRAKYKHFIKKGEDFFRIELLDNNEEKFIYYDEEKKLIVGPAEKKNFFFKIFPFIISRENFNLVYYSQAERRRFFNRYITYFFPEYKLDLLRFNKILKERNALLKQGKFSFEELDIWDKFFTEYATKIIKKRREFIDLVNQVLKKNFLSFFSDIELFIDYNASFDIELFRSKRKEEIFRKMTLSGPHRDSYKFSLNGEEMLLFASQGQMKGFVIALIFAIAFLYFENGGENAIFLFDDIFEEFDFIRKKKVIELIESFSFQTFFTFVEFDKKLYPKGENFEIEEGKIKWR